MALRSSPLTPKFRWDDAAGRYRNARGEFVPQRDVRAAIDEYLENKSAQVKSLAEQLRNREISISQWQKQMEQNIARVHLANAAAAKGGWHAMTQSDYGRVGQQVREEYKRLREFGVQIENELPLDGRFVNRAQQYAQAGRTTYENFQRREMEARGHDEERSVLHASDSCAGCLAAADRSEDDGWKPIGSLPLPGTRDCLRNCKCTMEYRKVGDDVSSMPSMVSTDIDPSSLDPEIVARMAPAQEHPFVPKGKPISEALSLRPELNHLEYAVKAQARVHGDGELDGLTVGVLRGGVKAKKFTAGSYTPGEEPIMVVHLQDQTAGLSLLHENGHWLHDQAIAKVDRSYGQPARTRPEELRWNDDMAGIKKAVLNSPEVKTAQSYQGKKEVFGKRNGKNYVKYDVDAEYVDYILSDRELFARAYAQYVVSRAGDERLSAELASQILFRKATDIGGRTPESLHYFEYWNSENFKSIAAEFDKLFLSKGWIARP